VVNGNRRWHTRMHSVKPWSLIPISSTGSKGGRPSGNRFCTSYIFTNNAITKFTTSNFIHNTTLNTNLGTYTNAHRRYYENKVHKRYFQQFQRVKLLSSTFNMFGHCDPINEAIHLCPKTHYRQKSLEKAISANQRYHRTSSENGKTFWHHNLIRSCSSQDAPESYPSIQKPGINIYFYSYFV